MGDPVGKGRKCGFRCISRSVVATLAFAVIFPNLSVSEEVRIASGVTVKKYFRTKDVIRPRLGFVLDVVEFSKSGHNFEFCDGERATVDIEALTPATSGCDGVVPGTFKFSINQPPVRLYSQSFQEIGELKFGEAEAAYGIEATVTLDHDALEVLGFSYLDAATMNLIAAGEFEFDFDSDWIAIADSSNDLSAVIIGDRAVSENFSGFTSSEGCRYKVLSSGKDFELSPIPNQPDYLGCF